MAYITRADLEAAVSPATIVACCDDDRDEVADPAPVAAIIARAEGMVDSFLTNYARPFPTPTDRLIKAACIDFAVAFTFERHPEYVRGFGERERASHYMRAIDIMKRVQAAVQQPPDAVEDGNAPTNVGGVVVDNGPRIMIDSSDGSSNSGLF